MISATATAWRITRIPHQLVRSIAAAALHHVEQAPDENQDDEPHDDQGKHGGKGGRRFYASFLKGSSVQHAHQPVEEIGRQQAFQQHAAPRKAGHGIMWAGAGGGQGLFQYFVDGVRGRTCSG